MNTNFLKDFRKFVMFWKKNNITFEMLEHYQKDDNFKKSLEATGYISPNVDPMTLDPTMLTFEVEVDLTLTNKEALEATGRNMYVNDTVVKEAPRASKAKQKIYLFKENSSKSCIQLEKEYEKRNLLPVDLQTHAAFNKANPEFADTKLNATQWKNTKGRFYHAIFYLGGGRGVRVDQGDDGWFGGCWFVGVGKISS
jgi:hypothetical protein